MARRCAILIYLLASTPMWAASQDAKPSVVLEEGIQHFRDAAYREAIALLSVVDRLSSTPTKDRTRARFYLALSYAADGETALARATFRSLYELDLQFDAPEELPGQLGEMMERERSSLAGTMCRETACVSARAALRAGTFTDGQINPSCPCVDEAIDGVVREARELLVSREYAEAYSRTATLAELRPDHAEARLVADLARTGCDIIQGSLYDQLEKQLTAEELDQARRTAIAIRSGCEGVRPNVRSQVTERYQALLAMHVQRWQFACASVDRPGRERRTEYDAARQAIALLDDGQGINAAALSATEDSQCATPPCQFIVPYEGVSERSLRARSGLPGVVEVSLEIDTEGRIVRPDDPAWFKVSRNEDGFPERAREILGDWRFEPTNVPVCTVIAIDFQ